MCTVTQGSASTPCELPSQSTFWNCSGPWWPTVTYEDIHSCWCHFLQLQLWGEQQSLVSWAGVEVQGFWVNPRGLSSPPEDASHSAVQYCVQGTCYLSLSLPWSPGSGPSPQLCLPHQGLLMGHCWMSSLHSSSLQPRSRCVRMSREGHHPLFLHVPSWLVGPAWNQGPKMLQGITI